MSAQAKYSGTEMTGICKFSTLTTAYKNKYYEECWIHLQISFAKICVHNVKLIL